MATFLKSLESAPLRADAVATTAVPGDVFADPDRLQAAYAAALEAGVQVIRTATRGATRPGLAAQGLDGRVSELNWTAAQLARTVARPAGAFVAGAVGPVGSGPEAETHFTEQIGALLDGGVDAVFFEGFTDAAELDAALYAFRSLDCRPVLVSFTLANDAEGAERFAQWVDAGACLVELRCGPGGLWLPGVAPVDAWLAVRESDAVPAGAGVGLVSVG